MENHHIVILAGGQGKRMNSDLPKVLHTVNSIPMIVHVIQTAIELKPERIWIIVGQYRQIISSTIEQYLTSEKLSMLTFVDQPVPRGTGDAIKQIIPVTESLPGSTPILILSGDVPLIQSSMLKNLLDQCQLASLLATDLDNPSGNGRLICDEKGSIDRIVEEKDCDEEQKLITKVNCGTYVFKLSLLRHLLPLITNKNRSGEYYLTDLIELISKHHGSVINCVEVPRNLQYTLHNVNTQSDLQFVSQSIIE